MITVTQKKAMQEVAEKVLNQAIRDYTKSVLILSSGKDEEDYIVKEAKRLIDDVRWFFKPNGRYEFFLDIQPEMLSTVETFRKKVLGFVN